MAWLGGHATELRIEYKQNIKLGKAVITYPFGCGQSIIHTMSANKVAIPARQSMSPIIPPAKGMAISSEMVPSAKSVI